jgi:tRNA (guanosine-2'-O-)-methyltransferase
MNPINLDSLNNQEYLEALLKYLGQFVTEHKKDKFEKVLSERTRNLTVVLEDIFKSHNASAVMRTVECMGIQDVHIVEQRNAYDYNPYVLRGSGKWLTFYRYNESEHNMKICMDHLKSKGYQVLAASPHPYATDYSEQKIDKKTAVVFGAEETGISDFVKENADGLIKIPMSGFTESYNISVSAGIIFEDYQKKIRKNNMYKLTPDEIFTLRLEWYKKVVHNYEIHEKEFKKKHHRN